MIGCVVVARRPGEQSFVGRVVSCTPDSVTIFHPARKETIIAEARDVEIRSQSAIDVAAGTIRLNLAS